MGFLTDYVTKSQRKWQGTYIPEWMPAARWIVAAAAGVVLTLSFISGALTARDAPNDAGTGAQPLPVLSDGSEAAPASDPAVLPVPEESAAVPQQPAGETGSIPVPLYGGGGTMDVPAEAVKVARAAMRGLLTADFSGVPVKQGSRLPAVPNPQPGARVGKAVTVQEVGGVLTLAIDVDLDGTGPATAYPAAVTVAEEAGRFVYVP